jgi:hypothetical protein
MVDRYLTLDLNAEHATFSARLGLAVVDLAGNTDDPNATRAVQRVRAIAAGSSDAYVARTVIDHPVCATFTPREQHQLRHKLRAAGLDDSAHPGLEHRLIAALSHCPPAR